MVPGDTATVQAVVLALVAAGIDVVRQRGVDDPLRVEGSVDAELWLDDVVSRMPRCDLGRTVVPGGMVVVEASLGADQLLPVMVGVDRVGLVVGREGATRRIDVADGAVAVRALTPWPLSELDEHMAGRACRLVTRTADWVGGEVVHDTPCHLSWFRHEPREPRPGPVTS